MREGVYEEEDQEAREEESPWPPCQTASQRFQHGAVAAAVGGSAVAGGSGESLSVETTTRAGELRWAGGRRHRHIK